MSEKDYSPLSASCVRALNDKLYEKRKVAALDIERMVKDLQAAQNTTQIKKLLHVLAQEFTLSQNPNSRKGGLIGLAALAIALGKDAGHHVDGMVKPVLTCFYDSDSRIRYYGCESLYNIVKVARGAVLPYFNEIFDGLSKLAADPDQNVRSGCELLDRLIKDIVTESCAFDLVEFIPLLRERLCTKNPFARSFIVAWIRFSLLPPEALHANIPKAMRQHVTRCAQRTGVMTLDSVPDINMIVFLPDILDGLFQILDDPNPELRRMCEATLSDFLKAISGSGARVEHGAMVNILIVHAQSADALIQYTAVCWLKELVSLAGRALLPHAAGLVSVLLPCLAYDDEARRKTKEVARVVNSSVMRLVTSVDDDDVDTVRCGTLCEDEDDGRARDKVPPDADGEVPSTPGDSHSVTLVDTSLGEVEVDSNAVEAPPPSRLSVEYIVQVLTETLLHEHMAPRISALRWIYHLHLHTPRQISRKVDELFPLLLAVLRDPSDEVVLLDLQVLAEIAAPQHPQSESLDLHVATLPLHIADSDYFGKFMGALLQLFSADRQLLDDRGAFIIRQLSLLLSAEDIYRRLSETLEEERDYQFAAHMVQTLNGILLTSTELYDLRQRLKHLATQEACALFTGLYRSWCHSPVSTVALCLLTQNYEHAVELLALFADIEVTVEFLTEIDKLVQLLESPIFTYLRLQLLDAHHNASLVRALYGLLMLLPQSDAFHTLRHRLACVPNAAHLPPRSECTSSNLSIRSALQHINFSELRSHFISLQERHRQARRVPRTLNDIHSGQL